MNNLPAINTNINNQYSPQFIDPTEGATVAYNNIEYYDVNSKKEKTVVCLKYMINSDFVIAETALYKHQSNVDTVNPKIKLLKMWEFYIDELDDKIIMSSNRTNINYKKYNALAYYKTDKARVLIPKDKLTDITSEATMPLVDDEFRQDETWMITTRAEAETKVIDEANRWNTDCIELFKRTVNDQKNIDLLYIHYSNKWRTQARADHYVDACNNIKNSILKFLNDKFSILHKGISRKIKASIPDDMMIPADSNHTIQLMNWLDDVNKDCTGSKDNGYLDQLKKTFGVSTNKE
jgi:hypothetical protein